MTLLSPSITRAAALTMTVDNFRLTESSMQARGFLRRDGLASVFPSATGLSQTVSWLESRRFAGLPNSDAAIEWSATFAPPQGVTITPGEPLPDGTYLLNGSFELWEGKRFAHFTVTTVEALEYSAECAAQVAAGMGVRHSWRATFACPSGTTTPKATSRWATCTAVAARRTCLGLKR